MEKIYHLALDGALANNSNEVINNVREFMDVTNDVNIMNAILLGVPKIISIDIERYAKKHESSKIINNSIVEKHRRIDIISNQVAIDVEYAQIKWTNEQGLDQFINRSDYQRRYKFTDVVSWYNIKDKETDECNIPFRCTQSNTFYISLDCEEVKYTR